MTKSNKLKKIIEFAVERGWDSGIMKDFNWEADDAVGGVFLFPKGSVRGSPNDGFIGISTIIFSHDFAKAVFGEREVNPIGGYTATFRTVNPIKKYEYHLQQIVLLEPEKIIDYYYKYVKS